MDELIKLRDDLSGIVTGFESGDYKSAATSLAATIVDLVGLSGVFFATADTAAVTEEITAHCEKLKTLLARPEMKAAPGDVGAIGDGTFLKLILPILLDALLKWLNKPTTP